MGANDGLECPFCDFVDVDFDILALHIKALHDVDVPDPHPSGPEDGAAQDSPPTEPGFIKCTRPGCGAHVTLSEVDEHLELHNLVDDDRVKEGPDSQPEPLLPSPKSRDASPHEGLKAREAELDLPSGKRRKLQRAPPRLRSTNNDLREGDGLLKWLGLAPNVRPNASSRIAPNERVEDSLKAANRAPHSGKFSPRLTATGRSVRERHKRTQDRSDLGPYAREKAMPTTIKQILLSARTFEVNVRTADGSTLKMSVAENETRGLVNLLADLSALDATVSKTYLCISNVHHVSKLPNEGSFCGYRNIQMMSSHLNHVYSTGKHSVSVPDIFQIQDIIESAWDNGICEHCRIQTGGIRGTRKWIGSEEFVAFCTQLGVVVQAVAFQTVDDGTPAHEALLDHVEAYFMGSPNAAAGSRVIKTSLPPIYFQQPGHSLTVVGLERLRDGSRRLLVFDPLFPPTREIWRLLKGGRLGANADLGRLLRAYRKGVLSLRRHDEFELVTPMATSGSSEE